MSSLKLASKELLYVMTDVSMLHFFVIAKYLRLYKKMNENKQRSRSSPFGHTSSLWPNLSRKKLPVVKKYPLSLSRHPQRVCLHYLPFAIKLSVLIVGKQKVRERERHGFTLMSFEAHSCQITPGHFESWTDF